MAGIRLLFRAFSTGGVYIVIVRAILVRESVNVLGRFSVESKEWSSIHDSHVKPGVVSSGYCRQAKIHPLLHPFRFHVSHGVSHLLLLSAC